MGTDPSNEEIRSTTKREMAGFSLVFVTLYYILELLYIGPKTNVIIVSGFLSVSYTHLTLPTILLV